MPDKISSTNVALLMMQARAAKKHAETALECTGRLIMQLREMCSHRWVFRSQINANSTERWAVTYQCEDCDAKRKQVQPPVCPSCMNELVKADQNEDSVRAATFAYDTKHGAPRAPENTTEGWFCTNCKTITCLRTIGD